jgi:hypothetical protein
MNTDFFLDIDTEFYRSGEIKKLKNLYYGGYSALSIKNSDNDHYKLVQVIIFNNDGKYNGTLLPNSLKVPNNFISSFKNNTVAIGQQLNNTLKIHLAEYKKFIQYGKVLIL